MKLKLILCLVLVLNCYCNAALTYPKEPEGGRQVVSEFVGRMMPNIARQQFKDFRIEDLTFANPYQNYIFNLTNLISGKFLSSAKTGGQWEYLLCRGTNAVVLAWLAADAKTGTALKCDSFSFANGTNEDKFINGKLKGLRVAEQLPQVQKENYEVRSLDMYPLCFWAVWLHGRTNNIIIPIAPPRWAKWKAYQPYSESEIAKLLKPEAENN